jgi:hypothetical protein
MTGIITKARLSVYMHGIRGVLDFLAERLLPFIHWASIILQIIPEVFQENSHDKND